MIKKLTRIGNSVGIVLDKPILEHLGLEEGSEVEVSTNGNVVLVTPLRPEARRRKLSKLLAEMDDQYGGVFERLAK
jgi:antitoxin MazE